MYHKKLLELYLPREICLFYIYSPFSEIKTHYKNRAWTTKANTQTNQILCKLFPDFDQPDRKAKILKVIIYKVGGQPYAHTLYQRTSDHSGVQYNTPT